MMAESNGQDQVVQDSQTILGGEPDAQDTSVVGQDGSVSTEDQGSVELPKWTEQTPTEYRQKLAGYATYKDFLKDATELIEHKDSLVRVPSDDASSEDWDSFFTSVGRPADPDGYGIQGDDDLMKDFRSIAHSSGLSTRQAKGLLAWYQESTKQQSEAFNQRQKESYQEVQKQLKDEWGNDYDKNLKFIERFGKKYGGPEVKAALQNPLIGNNPVLIRLFAKAGKDLVGETLVEGSPANPKADDAPAHLAYPWMKDAYPTKPE